MAWAGGWLLVFAALAPAQPLAYRPPGVPVRPTTSPYLNLNRPGSQAINYYNLVRPEIDFRNNLNNLQQQVGTLNQAAAAPATGAIADTGHPVQFMNFGGYYPQSLAGAAGRGRINYGGVARPLTVAPTSAVGTVFGVGALATQVPGVGR
jgi:hypothetical protein